MVDHERLNDDGLPDGGGAVTQRQAGGVGDPRHRRRMKLGVESVFFVWKNITN